MPDDGFTLVEVMVSLGIFLVVSGAVLGLIVTSVKTVNNNADRVYAAALAQTELDALRSSDAESLVLGQSSKTVGSGGATYTVKTTATWVDIGAIVNPCNVGDGVNPGKAYLRVRVDVEGGDLGAPQTVEAVIYPTDMPPSENVGTMTVAATDASDQPVEGVTVTGSDGVQTFQQVTGPDGCIFAPDLRTDGQWIVSVSKSGYITEQLTGGSQSGVTVEEQKNTPIGFAMDTPGSLVFTAGTSGYPVPAGMPFQFTPDTLDRAPDTFTTFPVTVTGLWPDSYTGWLRPCLDAGTGSSATAQLTAGSTVTMDLGGAKVQLVGPAGESVSAVYDGGPCASTEYPLGTWDDSLLRKVTLPAGTWTFTVAGGSPASQTVELAEGGDTCSVRWGVPGAVQPGASESPTPAPSGSEEPTSAPSPTLTLPEVSDPCPAGS